MAKRLWSVFTDDMEHCYFTGTSDCQRHHIFYGSRRKQSEAYGFVIPIASYMHRDVHNAPNTGLDLQLKQMAQTYYEEHNGTRDNFIAVFGKSWL